MTEVIAYNRDLFLTLRELKGSVNQMKTINPSKFRLAIEKQLKIYYELLKRYH